MEHLVTETKEVSGRKEVDVKVNEYLQLGWIILKTWIEDYGDPSMRLETIHVLLGWIDRTMPPSHPVVKQEGGYSF